MSAAFTVRALCLVALVRCLEATADDDDDNPSGVPFYYVKLPRLLKEHAQCKCNERYIENSNNFRDCAQKVSDKGGWYYAYGKVSSGPTPPPTPTNFTESDVKTSLGSQAQVLSSAAMLMRVGSCIQLYNEKDNCPDGIQEPAPYDYFAMDLYKVKTVKIRGNVDCKAQEEYKGKFANLSECAKAVVQTPNGQYFIFGNGHAAQGFGGSVTGFAQTGACYVKEKTSYNCPQGFKPESSHLDFYGLEYTKIHTAEEGAMRRRRRRARRRGGWGADPDSMQIKTIKEGKECKSKDEYVGWYSTKEKCASAVKKKGGKYFLYGTWHKSWLCYMETTASASCPEGFSTNNFDFYEIAENTPAPTTAEPTISPTLNPATTASPTGNPTMAPTEFTSSPTESTSSPSEGTSSPSAEGTSSPTESTSSPTGNTLSPTVTSETPTGSPTLLDPPTSPATGYITVAPTAPTAPPTPARIAPTTAAPTATPIAVTAAPTATPIAVTAAPTATPIAVTSAPTATPIQTTNLRQLRLV